MGGSGPIYYTNGNPQNSLVSPAIGHWGTCPRLNNYLFFQCTLTCTKSDNNYMSTVASCKNPVTFACATPGTKSYTI